MLTKIETKTLHQLEPGTLFRDRDALWRVEEGGDTDNILATRIARYNVNNTGELMFYSEQERGTENYNAYNEVRLVAGIYEVMSQGIKSLLLAQHRISI